MVADGGHYGDIKSSGVVGGVSSWVSNVYAFECSEHTFERVGRVFWHLLGEEQLSRNGPRDEESSLLWRLLREDVNGLIIFGHRRKRLAGSHCRLLFGLHFSFLGITYFPCTGYLWTVTVGGRFLLLISIVTLILLPLLTPIKSVLLLEGENVIDYTVAGYSLRHLLLEWRCIVLV